MGITKFDVIFILSMSLSLVILNFTMPALGFQDPNVNESDIPNYNITQNQFNYIKEPKAPKPLAPSQGTLNHSSNQFDNYQGAIQYELGDNADGNRTFLVVNPENTTYILDVENNSEDDSHTFSSNNQEVTLSANGFTIDIYSRDITTGVYDYIITARPSDQSWYSGIPLIGGIFSTGNQLEGTIAWIGTIIYPIWDFWIDGSLNFGSVVFQNIIYIIDLFHWQITTYFAIVGYSSESWVSLILAIPGLGLSLEFLKLIVMGIKLLPVFG